MRSTLASIPAIVLVVLLAGCTSPGKSFDYFDLSFAGQPSVTSTSAPFALMPSPSTTSLASINFTLFNAAHEPMANVAWRAFRDDLATTPIANGTVASIAGLAELPVSFTVDPNTDHGALGVHTYFMVIDPDNHIAEQDETNNVASAVVAFADFDLVLSPPVVSPGVVTPATPIVLTVPVTNIDTSLKALTASGVVIQVLETTTSPPVVVASGTMADIAATLTGTLVLTIPATTVGTHVYEVVVDPQGLFIEGSKTNNTAIVVVQVAPVAPG